MDGAAAGGVVARGAVAGKAALGEGGQRLEEHRRAAGAGRRVAHKDAVLEGGVGKAAREERGFKLGVQLGAYAADKHRAAVVAGLVAAEQAALEGGAVPLHFHCAAAPAGEIPHDGRVAQGGVVQEHGVAHGGFAAFIKTDRTAEGVRAVVLKHAALDERGGEFVTVKRAAGAALVLPQILRHAGHHADGEVGLVLFKAAIAQDGLAVLQRHRAAQQTEVVAEHAVLKHGYHAADDHHRAAPARAGDGLVMHRHVALEGAIADGGGSAEA